MIMASGLHTSGNGQIQTTKASSADKDGKQKEQSIAGLLQAMGPEIARALPKHLTGERMARVCLTALRTTPDLAKCTPASFMGSIMACAQLGLEPNTPLGHAYLIPYKDKKKGVTICQLMIGYQGMIELAYRSGRVDSIKAMVVREGDIFDFDHGLDEKLIHKPCGNEEAPITHAYAIARIKGGAPIFWVLSMPQIEARRLSGASKYAYTPWNDHYEAMAMKSAVRALFKWIPKSAEMAQVIHAEDLADKGKHFSAALPEVAESLQRASLPAPESIDVGAYDKETGEVTNAPREPGTGDDEIDPEDA
jgi:recombination protein RecT